MIQEVNARPVFYRYLAVDDLKMFYREAGDASAPVLLLLHGFATSSHMFRDLMGRLSHRFRVIAPDLPGFGQTVVPAGFKYTFAALTKAVQGFVSGLQLEQFALYIFDYGAPIGFRLALAEPSRVTALISQNGNAYEEGLSGGWAPLQAYWAEPTAANRDALRMLLTPETTRWQYAHGTDESKLSPDGYTLDSALLARQGQDEIQLDLFLDYASNVTLYPAFQQWLRVSQVPLLAVWGKNDPFFLPAGAEAFRRDVPHADIRLLDTGHFALETHAAEIAAAICSFLPESLVKRKDPDEADAKPVAVVGRFYQALNSGDVPAVLALLDPEVEWTESERFPYFSGTWRGPAMVRDHLLARIAQDWTAFQATANDFIADGEQVVSFGEYSGTFQRTGRSMRVSFSHRWSVRGGRITQFRMYTDTAKILEAMRPEA